MAHKLISSLLGLALSAVACGGMPETHLVLPVPVAVDATFDAVEMPAIQRAIVQWNATSQRLAGVNVFHNLGTFDPTGPKWYDEGIVDVRRMPGTEGYCFWEDDENGFSVPACYQGMYFYDGYIEVYVDLIGDFETVEEFQTKMRRVVLHELGHSLTLPGLDREVDAVMTQFNVASDITELDEDLLCEVIDCYDASSD